MEASGHLPLGLFSLKAFCNSSEWRQTHSPDSPKGILRLALPDLEICFQGSVSTTKSRTSAHTSVSFWQNSASCFQDNVLKQLIKGFLDITSPCKAVFCWLNYKWIRNTWSEFRLGLAKHTLDLIPSRIFERCFQVFVESNQHGFTFPSSLSCCSSLRRGQRFLGVCLSLCPCFTRPLYKCRLDSPNSYLELNEDPGVLADALPTLSFDFRIVQEVSF